MKIKFGGSGDISTKLLEGAIEQIVRARTAHAALSIDSNLVVCLIREVLDKREALRVSEFILTESSIEDRDDPAEDEEDEEEEEVELRQPTVPKKRKDLVRFSSNKYWLDSWRKRVVVATVLFVLITLSLLTLL